MMFISSRPSQVRNDLRLYRFPYRIGIAEDSIGMWVFSSPENLTTNIPSEADVFAVNQKLIRLGRQIRIERLAILGINITPFEDDTLEVTVGGSDTKPAETWKQFDSLLSITFGLPIRL
jgi:hypothetical protein